MTVMIVMTMQDNVNMGKRGTAWHGMGKSLDMDIFLPFQLYDAYVHGA